ncbi:hypothetical protein DAEQUDRAFT_521731 [Daedalea quercina L-15889]|uniref:DUF6533 domain-containing protein n=1 Tax=Daedalea quercina L-15889 TaxID=1314783 RepID=A0A165MCW9_9APHY|nr:hypothetical protein DAEQUDRAFT_521731 [Daedalea quercina L-15889]
MSSNNAEEQVVLGLKTLYYRYICITASYMVFLYDHALTLSEEIEFIWRRRFTGVTVLYLLMNLFTFSYFFLIITSIIDEGCVSSFHVNFAEGAMFIAMHITWALISALRAYAIAGRSWAWFSIVLLFGLVPVATNIFFYAPRWWYIISDTDDGCFYGNNVPYTNHADAFSFIYESVMNLTAPLLLVETSTRVALMTVDVLVLCVTWRATYDVSKAARGLPTRLSVTSLLLRDGTIYFAVLFMLNILDLGLWLSNTFDNATIFSDALTTVMLSRFFLNLRHSSLAPASENYDVVSSPSQLPDFSLHFQSNTRLAGDSSENESRLYGNMGGISALVYSSDAWDDTADTEGTHEVKGRGATASLPVAEDIQISNLGSNGVKAQGMNDIT